MEYDGRHLKGMIASATRWLEKSAPQIDALNVFPVPDGDTGTNMLLTMRSVLEEASCVPDDSASAVMQAVARGALMGARGNSGVILSQMWRGLAEGLGDKPTFTAQDWGLAFKQASALAYKGLSQPVEGTILTVARQVAEVEVDSHDLVALLEAEVAAARESVAATPALLPVLQQAGVVDAGGQGLYTILEGALRFLRGQEVDEGNPEILSPSVPVEVGGTLEEEIYGYCTEFVVKGEGLSITRLRRWLDGQGQSVIVAGDQDMVKVHVHTLDPGRVLHYAARRGSLHEIQVKNMDEQYQEFLEKRRALAPTVPIAIVAVVSGEGLCQVFRSLGVSAIVHGGQSMNPSTREILQAVDAAPSDKVILLPNNKNIVPVARQAQTVATKEVAVVGTTSIPQGVAALLAFNYGIDLEANVEAMERARRAVKSVEITRAVRSTRFSDLEVKKGQAIALLDDQLVAAHSQITGLFQELAPRLSLKKAEVVTLYYGAGVKSEQAEEIKQLLRALGAPEVEVVAGGQPYYEYLLAIE